MSFDTTPDTTDAPSVATSAAAAQAHNPTTASPGKQADIAAAWSATIAAHGELTPDAPLAPVDVATDVDEPATADTDADADDETPAVVAKPVPKAKAKAAPVDEAAAAAAAAPKPATEVQALIAARREARERYDRREQAQTARFAAQAQQLEAQAVKLAPLQRAAEAIESGDFDAIAKALGEARGNSDVVDWTSLNSEALKAMQSPVYKRMRELERRANDDAKAREADATRQREAAADAQRQAGVAQWKRDMIDDAAADADPAIAAVVEARPQVGEALFAIQQAHYHATGDVMPARDAAVQFLSNVRNDFDFWSEFFDEHSESDAIKALIGDRPAKGVKAAAKVASPQAAARPAKTDGPPKAAKPKAPSISHTQTAQASAVGPMSSEQLKKHWARRIEQERLEGIPMVA